MDTALRPRRSLLDDYGVPQRRVPGWPSTALAPLGSTTGRFEDDNAVGTSCGSKQVKDVTRWWCWCRCRSAMSGLVPALDAIVGQHNSQHAKVKVPKTMEGIMENF